MDIVEGSMPLQADAPIFAAPLPHTPPLPAVNNGVRPRVPTSPRPAPPPRPQLTLPLAGVKHMTLFAAVGRGCLPAETRLSFGGPTAVFWGSRAAERGGP